MRVFIFRIVIRNNKLQSITKTLFIRQKQEHTTKIAYDLSFIIYFCSDALKCVYL